METTHLMDPAFWASETPAAPGADFCPGLFSEPDLKSLVFFKTSGSMGAARWIGLSREALRHSASVVNAHLGVGERSCWGLALPIRHVGGFGVVARAFEAGCSLREFGERWDAACFHAWLEEERVTHLSLVPTQVHDLIRKGLRAPSSLQAVVVGGGSLDDRIGQVARDLEWPVLASYGMTEAGSQVATQGLELLDKPYKSGRIHVLPHWELRMAGDERIAIRGRSLFAGELVPEGDGWRYQPRVDDWFVTRDLGALTSGGLVVRGRSDAMVKVLGELVDPTAVEQRLGMPEVCVVALADGRREHRLVAVFDDPEILKRVEGGVADYQREAPGFERIDEVILINQIPRSELGKVRRAELVELLEEREI